MILLGVVGASACPPAVDDLAYRVGREIATRGAALICGGRGGVMLAACRGAQEAGGLTIGVLPGARAEDANPYVQIPIVTDLGEARNIVLVRSARALIAIGGAYGTLSEIAFALKLGVPVVALGSWELTLPGGKAPAPIHRAGDAEEAVATALRLAESLQGEVACG